MADRAARRFADLKAVASLRNDLDDLLTCCRDKTLAEPKKVRTTSVNSERNDLIRYRTKVPGSPETNKAHGTCQDKTSMDRSLYTVFFHQNKSHGTSTQIHPTLKS